MSLDFSSTTLFVVLSDSVLSVLSDPILSALSDPVLSVLSGPYLSLGFAGVGAPWQKARMKAIQITIIIENRVRPIISFIFPTFSRFRWELRVRETKMKEGGRVSSDGNSRDYSLFLHLEHEQLNTHMVDVFPVTIKLIYSKLVSGVSKQNERVMQWRARKQSERCK